MGFSGIMMENYAKNRIFLPKEDKIYQEKYQQN
jgi:hypothetical protein